MGRFHPGQSGNPKGRPVGSRNRLGEAFVDALRADFEKHGVAVIARVRTEQPAQYLRAIASIVPREVVVEPTKVELDNEALVTRIHELYQSLFGERRSATQLTLLPGLDNE